MFDLNLIKYQYYNERDIEIPALISFLQTHPVNTLLDVGGHYSWNHYAPQVRELVKNYDAIDILPDPQTEKIVDRYTIGNVLDLRDIKYDLVTCISSIEHAGITTYRVEDYKEEQLRVFKKIVELSKAIFVTFPFGQEALHEGEFANITAEQLEKFKYLSGGVKTNFYFSEFPQGKEPWREVDIEFAKNVPYLREKGTRCICILQSL